MPRVLLDDAAVTDLERIFDHIGRTLKSLQAAARTILRIRESVDDYEEMIRLGVLTEKDRVELIRGEIAPRDRKRPLPCVLRPSS